MVATIKTVDDLLDKHLPPFYEAVGRIAYVWAMLEHVLDRIIWDLADTEQLLGACLTSQMNGPTPRLRALLTLLEAREWPEPLIKKVRQFESAARKSQEERNRAIHDPFFVTLSGSVRRQRTATINNKVVLGRYEPSLEEMRKAFDESRRLLIELNTIIDEIRSVKHIVTHDGRRRLKTRYSPFNERRISVDSVSGVEDCLQDSNTGESEK